MAPSGEAVAHLEIGDQRRALLVRGGAPDEILRAKFDPTERPARAEIVSIVTPSAARVEAPCAFVAACGGCDWMHLTRIMQRAQHVALTESVLRGVTAPITFHEASRDLAYRTRARLHARDHRIGFFSPRSRDLVIVDRCRVLDARIEKARAARASLFAGARGDGEIALALGKKMRSPTSAGRAIFPRRSSRDSATRTKPSTAFASHAASREGLRSSAIPRLGSPARTARRSSSAGERADFRKRTRT